MSSWCLQRPVEVKGLCPQDEEGLANGFLQTTGLGGLLAPPRLPGSHGCNQMHLNLGFDGLELPPMTASYNSRSGSMGNRKTHMGLLLSSHSLFVDFLYMFLS